MKEGTENVTYCVIGSYLRITIRRHSFIPSDKQDPCYAVWEGLCHAPRRVS